MNTIDRYIGGVMDLIWAPPEVRKSIETDLRAHLEAAVEAGEPAETAIVRMGNPTEVAVEFMSQIALPFEKFWRRFWAFAIDLVAIFLVGTILALTCIWLSNLVPQHPQSWEYLSGAALIIIIVSLALATLGIILLYFPILEGRFGQTVGKRLFHLRVLRDDGLPIGYKEAFLRRLSYYFDIMPVDSLFIFFTEKRQRGFDLIARTVVIHDTYS